mmetsp:Transcript_27454/g.46653  ORF Transcript_27454/g.46653 Transcript_27454/m.46653 type:complete len:133 (-) Transcript_27454:311-709(-)
MTNQAVFEVIGTIGGVSIALSLVPQVIHTYKIKKAGDISYIYQFIYIFGCTLVNIYAIPLGLWPIFVPCLIEQILIMMLTVMKYVYDKEEARNIMLLKEEGPTLHSVESTPIKASEEDSDVEAANVSNSNNN